MAQPNSAGDLRSGGSHEASEARKKGKKTSRPQTVKNPVFPDPLRGFVLSCETFPVLLPLGKADSQRALAASLRDGPTQSETTCRAKLRLSPDRFRVFRFGSGFHTKPRRHERKAEDNATTSGEDLFSSLSCFRAFVCHLPGSATPMRGEVPLLSVQEASSSVTVLCGTGAYTTCR